jgi:hypothetical protein
MQTSTYRFGAGTVSISAFWRQPNGNDATGSFVAPLLNLTLGICENCNSTSEASGSVSAILGPGRFDPTLAEILGVAERSLGGSLSFDGDLITGDGTSQSRLGGSASGQVDLIVTAAVPEPGLTALVVLGALIVRFRRRSSSAAR